LFLTYRIFFLLTMLTQWVNKAGSSVDERQQKVMRQ